LHNFIMDSYRSIMIACWGAHRPRGQDHGRKINVGPVRRRS
jgi:hypothetical protein